MTLEAGRRRFATTRWSLVIAAGDSGSPDATSALATLCETYWFPVYAFIRRSGRMQDDARDLTQGFFAQALEKNAFSKARQERGRFRSFLLTSVRHFLANQHDRDMAAKRGGGRGPLPLDFDDGERRYQNEPVDDETPEHVYERRWALTVLAQAVDRVGVKFERGGRHQQFSRLRPFLTGDEPHSYASLAADLGVSEGALRVAVHRLRQQFATSLRDAIAETVTTPEDIDEELRYLMTVIGR
jgi:DNA-directed RNA polymerase specialized sigma24 family protein